MLTCKMGVIILVLLISTGIAWARKTCPPYPNQTEACPVSIQELDFLHVKLHNSSDVEWFRDVQRNWPCAFRQFWARGWFHDYVEVVRFLYKFILPLEIIVGVAVNIFALMKIRSKQEHFIRTRRRRSTVYIFSQYQCWSDIGILSITCSMGYARSFVPAFDQIFIDCIYFCRVYKVLITFFQFSSPWLNVIIALNRLYDIKWPEMSIFRMTSKKAHWIMTTLFTLAFAIASTKFYYSGFEQYSAFEYERCEERGHTNVPVVLMYVALSTWLPSIIFIAINIYLTVVINEYQGNVNGNLRKDVGSWNDQKRKIIQTIWTVSVVYALVQVPLGLVETYELYWNLSKRREMCRSDRDVFVQWRIRKMSLKWFRALLYICNQIPFIVNFSCLLLTREDFRFWKRSGQPATTIVQQIVSWSTSFSKSMESPPLLRNSPNASYILHCHHFNQLKSAPTDIKDV